MKTLNRNRTLALKDVRRTLVAIAEAPTRLDLYRESEVLMTQAFYLREMATDTITKRGILYPAHDWEHYRATLKQERASA